MVGSSCSTSDTRCVNLVTNPVISHELGMDWEVFRTGSVGVNAGFYVHERLLEVICFRTTLGAQRVQGSALLRFRNIGLNSQDIHALYF